MTNVFIFLVGWVIGLFTGLIGFWAATREEGNYDYLNHDQNDEFTDQL